LCADWLAPFPFCSYHAQPVAPQLKARVAELANVHAEVALAKADVNFKKAQLEFLNYGSQPSGSDLGDVIYKALESVRLEGPAAITAQKKELRDDINDLEKTKIKELQATIKDLEETKIKELRSELKALQPG
jgi:hypothetical protein